MTSDHQRYSLTELANLAGVSVRTVRYYQSQGLLSSSGTSGPGAKYGEAHLDRLRLIRRLQREHLPLAEIRRQLDEMDDADYRRARGGGTAGTARRLGARVRPSRSRARWRLPVTVTTSRGTSPIRERSVAPIAGSRPLGTVNARTPKPPRPVAVGAHPARDRRRAPCPSAASATDRQTG